MANVDVYLNSKGEFLRASPITDKALAITIVPCTVKSDGRTSDSEPHPLADTLEYVSVDVSEYIKDIDEKKRKDSLKKHEKYLALLSEWCDADSSNQKIEAVRRYVSGGNVTKDLVNAGIFVVSEGKFVKFEKKDKKPETYKALSDSRPEKTFVRWHVEYTGKPGSDLSRDLEVTKSWTSFYLGKVAKETIGLDMVTGRTMPLTSSLPAYVRRDGDNAKLISSNDHENFTYLGRFTRSNQASTIGYETSQKAFLALRWLIRKQGKSIGNWCFVSWYVSDGDVCDVAIDPESQLFGDCVTKPVQTYSGEEVSKILNDQIEGFFRKERHTNMNDIVMLSMSAPTKGRLAILFYKEMTTEDFSETLRKWYETCSWPRKVSIGERGNRKQTIAQLPPSI